ncbi:unnamed protein product, partial [Trichogramma brassicae]
ASAHAHGTHFRACALNYKMDSDQAGEVAIFETPKEKAICNLKSLEVETLYGPHAGSRTSMAAQILRCRPACGESKPRFSPGCCRMVTAAEQQSGGPWPRRRSCASGTFSISLLCPWVRGPWMDRAANGLPPEMDRFIPTAQDLRRQGRRGSLSCEVHPGKEGVCYFGDESRGHVLSHTFSLKDAQARGLRKWCSFIVLMKDKQYLLNMWPFLVDNLKEIIRELQEFAIKKYNAEEAECPQRVVRLANGDKSSNKLSRGFSEITNEKNVFVRVHMWFVWILSAGARHFVEVLPLSLIDEEIDFNLGVSLESDKGFTLLNAKSPVNLNVENQIPDFKDFIDLNPVSVLRKLKNKVGFDQFRQLLYATLIGTQILIRGSPAETLESLYGLCSLVPRACQIVRVGAKEYIDSKSCNFISVDTSVAVPFPCAAVCRLDILPEEHLTEGNKSHVVRWTGQLPAKLPTLQIKLEKALGNDKLTDTVLHVHFSTLQEEWSNISKVVHAMRGRGHRGDLTSLLISLGAGPQDRKLIDGWSMGLPSNPA